MNEQYYESMLHHIISARTRFFDASNAVELSYKPLYGQHSKELDDILMKLDDQEVRLYHIQCYLLARMRRKYD